MTNEERASETFKTHFNCAQAVLTTYCSKFGMAESEAKKISCGFGAGCARQSLTCGAVSGAFMVIGLKFGQSKESIHESRELTYIKIREFSDKFKALYGSVNCYELLGCDLSTEEGQRFFKENDMFNNECMNYVKSACIILDEIVL